MSDYERISITIEPELLARLDAHIAESGHANRSEAVRDMIRAGLLARTGAKDLVAGSLTVVYDHRQRALASRMIDAAHSHEDIVLSTLHVHLDADRCMELSALRGPRAALEHYAEHLIHMKGVLHGSLTLTEGAD
ncbi:MAG: nickel-responsive transcriptional regulator NikR [Alphaproteobacteria bacterium]|nr:nickel-responsive transcriptional regulator NikR [Alphaproteobacteria bacterium]